MKIVTILGARPQFVKAAAVSRAISGRSSLNEVIVHTGQHYDDNMSDIFFKEMNIPTPKYNLGVHGSSHSVMTGKMMEGIETVLLSESPDWVLVYGDTNSTLAAALTASKLHMQVAHIEAGLRSFNMRMPEEVNRIVTDRLSNLLFCPTEAAVKNLRKEGFPHLSERIVLSGDVMQDAAMYYSKMSASKSDILERLSLGDFLLATVHRQENTDDELRLRDIISALNELNSSVKVVMPVHPRTLKIIEGLSLEIQFVMIPPVGYFDMIELLKGCKLVLTDSGGLQKEAFFFGKGCLTLRDETEWVELVDGGYNILCGSERGNIIDGYDRISQINPDYTIDLYGGGSASNRIVQELSL